LTWIQDGIYAAGGEHLPKNWASFIEQTGITAVFHLRALSSASFIGPAPTSFLWINLEGEAGAGLEERRLAATFIAENLKMQRRVLLHCSHRRHRIRWAYMAYLIWSGKSIKASLTQVQQKPWLAPYHTDMKIWQEFKEFIAADRNGKSLQKENGGEL
jgi:hypothetical protein